VGLGNEEARVTLGVEETRCGEFGSMFKDRGERVVDAGSWLDVDVVCTTSACHTKMRSVEMEIKDD
jgi:hypothetical protein